jgi:hypothetical protein
LINVIVIAIFAQNALSTRHKVLDTAEGESASARKA